MSPPDGTNEPAASAGARRVTSLGALVAPSGSRAARVDIGTQAAATASIARPAALGARAAPRVRAAVVDSAAPPARARSQLLAAQRAVDHGARRRARATPLPARPLLPPRYRTRHRPPPPAPSRRPLRLIGRRYPRWGRWLDHAARRRGAARLPLAPLCTLGWACLQASRVWWWWCECQGAWPARRSLGLRPN